MTDPNLTRGDTMNEILRRAASKVRDDVAVMADETAAQPDPFLLAVADWLEDIANRIVLSRQLRHEDDEHHALAVARAYLVEVSR